MRARSQLEVRPSLCISRAASANLPQPVDSGPHWIRVISGLLVLTVAGVLLVRRRRRA
jgi:MYXO-CTERM domain-containing protein